MKLIIRKPIDERANWQEYSSCKQDCEGDDYIAVVVVVIDGQSATGAAKSGTKANAMLLARQIATKSIKNPVKRSKAFREWQKKLSELS